MSNVPVPKGNTFAELDLLALLLASTEQGFWFIDNALLTTDANPAMCRMLRTTREQMLGRSIYDYVDETNAEIFRHHVRLRAQGIAEGYEIALLRADGTLVDCYNNATPVFNQQGVKVGAIGLFSDISAQKRDQRELARTSELLSQKSQVLERTLDSLSQGVLSLDAAGHINAYNHRALELLELPESLMADKPSLARLIEYQMQRGDLDPYSVNMATRRLARGMVNANGLVNGPWRDNYRRVTRSGRVLEVESFGSPDGGAVRTYTDITERLHAERGLIDAKDEAERANRAKSDFLSRMSHELRTPLNAIIGFGQLLQSDPEHALSLAQQQRVHELLRGGRHLLALINEVLDLSRIEAGALPVELGAQSLWPLIDEALELVAAMAEARAVRLELAARPSVDAPPVLVRADATRLKQVLLNLLSNAIKYNREGGCVRLVTKLEGTRLVLEVSDEGPGLDAAQQARLFQAFERMDARRSSIEGAGIGLALSKQLMVLMGGEVGVRSAPGEGSTFWLSLPLAVDAAAVDGSAGVPAQHAMSPNKRAECVAEPPVSQSPAAIPAGDVLYIEDNEVNQLLMQGMLARRPALALRMATRPEEGLHMAEQSPPNLVLLDIQLPGMDGFEVLQRLRAHESTRHIPVVAVSANAMNSDIAAAQAAGFDDYLTKPLDMQRLLEVVDHWVVRQR